MGKEAKKKTHRKPTYKKKYTQENVMSALSAIDEGMSLRKAAQLYKVPRTTLSAKWTYQIPVEVALGRKTYLTYEEEKHLVKWIFYCCDRGYPVSKDRLVECVQKIIREDQRETPFKNDKPGRHWWEGFHRRHPEISKRIAQNLSTSRAAVTSEILKKWFEQVETHLEKLSLRNIDPSRIFNLDESAFLLVPKADSFLAPRGTKAVYRVVNGNEKENLTVLFTVNAAGILLPPMVLFCYERVPSAIVKSFPPSRILGNISKGWMTAETFYSYITEHFYPWLVQNNIELPVILYVDGHVSHMTLPLSLFCKEKKIELIALYPNATHILQPLDVSVFHPLKNKWKKELEQWRSENETQKFKKEEFSPLLKKTLNSWSNLSISIINGFRTCGLSPFSSEAIDYTIFNKKKRTQPVKKTEQGTENNLLSKEEAEKYLAYLEHWMEPRIVDDFRNVMSNKKLQPSEEKNHGLFLHWMQLQHLAGKRIDENATMNEVLPGTQRDDRSTEVIDFDSTIMMEEIVIENLEIDFLPSSEVDNLIEPDDHSSLPLIASISEPENEERDAQDATILESNNTVIEQPLQVTDVSVQVVDVPDQPIELPALDLPKIIPLQSIENREIHASTSEDCFITNNIPSPLRRILPWPQSKTLPGSGKKKKPFIAPLTSEQWQEREIKIKEEKMKRQAEVENRKIVRAETKKAKAEEAEKKKKEKEERKAIAEEKKRAAAANKMKKRILKENINININNN